MDITLVVLAAGIGARYGAGIKQLAAVGPNGEIIIDYSIHDAVKAGFNKIVVIIRRDLYAEFKEIIGDRLAARLAAKGVKWEYAFQELTDPPAGRTKPWGTGQAILCCRDLLNGPFAVVNADDYYGKRAYEQAYAFLKNCKPEEPYRFGMVGFVLKNTLSDVGGVTRGVCTVDGAGKLAKIVETRHITKTPAGAVAPGPDGREQRLDGDSLVSMNMWMLTPAFVAGLEQGFASFKANMKDPLKDEYLLPEIVDAELQAGRASVEVLPSHDRWFGVTYQEDKAMVVEEFKKLYDQGVYNREDLFSDL